MLQTILVSLGLAAAPAALLAQTQTAKRTALTGDDTAWPNYQRATFDGGTGTATGPQLSIDA